MVLWDMVSLLRGKVPDFCARVPNKQALLDGNLGDQSEADIDQGGHDGQDADGDRILDDDRAVCDCGEAKGQEGQDVEDDGLAGEQGFRFHGCVLWV